MTDTADQPDFADTLEANMIADLVADKMTVVEACRTLGLCKRTIYRRIGSSERFRQMMEEAREVGFDGLASDALKVIRGEEGHSSGDVKRDRLIAEYTLKLLSKWHPNRYGEKLQVEQKTATVAIPVSDDPVAAAEAYERLMRGG